MKTEVGCPDPMPPGLRRLIYWGFCWMNRHPGVWRSIGAALRFWPFLSQLFPFVARRSSVKQVLMRPRSFSNTSHGPNLIASDFLIGMDPGAFCQLRGAAVMHRKGLAIYIRIHGLENSVNRQKV